MRKRNLNRHAVYTNHVTQQKKETKSVQFLITKIVWSAGHRPPRTSFPDPDQRTTKQTHGRQQVQGRPETRVSAPRPSPPLSPATRSASFRTPFPHRHRHTHSHSPRAGICAFVSARWMSVGIPSFVSVRAFGATQLLLVWFSTLRVLPFFWRLYTTISTIKTTQHRTAMAITIITTASIDSLRSSIASASPFQRDGADVGIWLTLAIGASVAIVPM